MTSTRGKGIRDFKAKQKLLTESTVASNFTAFLIKTVSDYNKALLPTNGDLRLDLDLLRQAAQKWNQNGSQAVTPEGKYLRYWQWVMSRIGVDITAHAFFKVSFMEFLHLLRRDVPHAVSISALKNIYDDRSNRLPQAELQDLKRLLDDYNDDAPSSGFGRVDTPFDAEFEGIQSGINDGQVRSWQCYLTPEAARQWNALVENGTYAMYSACLGTFEALLQSEPWKRAVAEGAYNVGVALAGGGSPEKDMLLAAALAKGTQDEVQYWLIDVSPEMIHHSQRGLDRMLRQPDYSWLASRIRIMSGQRIDILHLPRFFARPHDWSAVVWTLLGGTLGNLPEWQFFDSLATVSRADDLMIIGLDTHEGETWEGFQSRIRTQYQGEEVYDLLLEGRQGPDRHVELDFRQSRGREVPQSWIAEFRAQCNGQKVIVTSTRYLLKEFLKYANQRGWKHLGTTVATGGSTFRQLLLRRV